MTTNLWKHNHHQMGSTLMTLVFLAGCSSGDPISKVSRRGSTPQAADGNPVSATTPGDNVEKDLPIVPAPNPTPSDVPLKEIPTPFALRTFSRVNATMASLTGVRTLPANIVSAATQDALMTMLPGENRLTDFQGGSQFATYKLAAEYCNLMVDNESARPTVLSGVDLRSAPPQALNVAGKTAVIKAFTGKFWVLPPTNLTQAQGLLSDLVNELMAGRNLTTPAQTTAIVKAVCTATLASAPVTFY